MTDKEKADSLIELHKEQMNHFRQTRDIEFKINIALWTIIILAGYYLDTKISLDKNICQLILYIIVSFIITLCHYFLWLSPIARSQRADDHFINEYRHKVEDLTQIQIKPFKGIRSIKSWIFFETAITFLLLIIIGILFYIKQIINALHTTLY